MLLRKKNIHTDTKRHLITLILLIELKLDSFLPLQYIELWQSAEVSSPMRPNDPVRLFRIFLADFHSFDTSTLSSSICEQLGVATFLQRDEEENGCFDGLGSYEKAVILFALLRSVLVLEVLDRGKAYLQNGSLLRRYC